MRSTGLKIAALGMTAAMALAACGGSAEKTTPTPGAAPPAPAAPAGPTLSASELDALAATAAKKAGPATSVPKLTIGYLRYVAQSPADQRMYDSAVAAAKILGWTVIPCDGQGDPAKMAACGNTLLDQNIDVLLNDGIPQTVIATALQRARREGVPTVYSGGSLDKADLYTAGYVPPDGEMGTTLATYVASQLKERSGGAIVQGFPASWGVERVDALKAAGVKIASQQDADATNLVQGTQQQIAAQLNQHPDASAVWITFETAVLGAAQAVKARYPGKQFPDRPLLATFYANRPTLDLMRKGQVDAAVENSLEWSSWAAIDQIAELKARKTPMSKDVRPNYGAGLDFWRSTLVTKDNLPPAGQLVPPPVDYEAFFTAKWKYEFGTGN
ncbi:sugar ABC transporter substrate-binding protein [Spirillospora sp. NPDC048819]|uniref:sugar ABC transporter substrate-binding protein n=1 Tax=Spirillospora sp. NPDC048819 TaxID=3155268 RepID=UPI00340A6D61